MKPDSSRFSVLIYSSFGDSDVPYSTNPLPHLGGRYGVMTLAVILLCRVIKMNSGVGESDISTL